MSQATINNLLDDKLFQVIGSTPASIAEAMRKIDIRGKSSEGAQIFAVSLFAAAVNKATLETFLADSRFAAVRPLLASALAIQGRANMTAMTLLGHCFLTTSLSSDVVFAVEFRKKLGQDHIWAGNLDSGSLSEKQKKILLEKKRVTREDEAKALGSGFLKFVGIDTSPFSELEAKFFDVTTNRPESRMPTVSRIDTRQEPIRRRAPSDEQDPALTQFTASDGTTYSIPIDVMNFRRNVLRRTDADIEDSIKDKGVESFISRTRTIMQRDPDGSRTLRAESVVGQ